MARGPTERTNLRRCHGSHWALGWLGKVSTSKRQRPSLEERSWFLGLLGYWAIGRETSPDCLRIGDGAVQAAGGLRKMR